MKKDCHKINEKSIHLTLKTEHHQRQSTSVYEMTIEIITM